MSSPASAPLTMLPDAEYFIRKYALHGYLYGSVLLPPIYASWVFVKHGRGALTATKFLRTTWISSFAASGVVAGLGYLKFSSMDPARLQSRRVESTYDANRVRLEDHAVIGGVLCSVLLPALLWRKTKPYHLILGGASIGAAIGTWTHYIRYIFGPPIPVQDQTAEREVPAEL